VTQALAVTPGATDGFQLMLLSHHTDFRHIEDLTALRHAARDSTEVLTALATHLAAMRHHLIGLLDQRKPVSRMASLPTWTLATPTTSPPRQTGQPIRGGRLTARATVLSQALFQLPDARLPLGQLLFQRKQLPSQRFEQPLFFSQGLQFFFLRHGSPLAVFLSFGKSLGDLSSYGFSE
jgi:hypothetical protein